MEQLGKILGENLTFLRKKAGLTQLEFGEKFSYSDKSVSRWEQGEIIPSVETLKEIADFYQVSVDFLLTEHNENTDFLKVIKNTPNYTNKMIIIALIVTLVITIAITIFVAGLLTGTVKRGWLAFVWMNPVIFLVVAYAMKRMFHSKKGIIVCLSGFVWTILLSAYLTFLYGNYWYLFFIGVPLQAALILTLNLK